MSNSSNSAFRLVFIPATEKVVDLDRKVKDVIGLAAFKSMHDAD